MSARTTVNPAAISCQNTILGWEMKSDADSLRDEPFPILFDFGILARVDLKPLGLPDDHPQLGQDNSRLFGLLALARVVQWLGGRLRFSNATSSEPKVNSFGLSKP